MSPEAPSPLPGATGVERGPVFQSPAPAPLIPGDCWEWAGPIDRHGYGRVTSRGRRTGAHRVAYEMFVGPIPAGLELDHLCRNPGCINPNHLEPVTHAENMRRGVIWQRLKESKAAITHCPRGHPYDDTNTYIYKTMRSCRICVKERGRAWRQKNRDRINQRQRDQRALSRMGIAP